MSHVLNSSVAIVRSIILLYSTDIIQVTKRVAGQEEGMFTSRGLFFLQFIYYFCDQEAFPLTNSVDVCQVD